MTSVAIEGLAKTYPGGTVALAPASLAIASGEVLALLGPSGCGKTTLLRLLAGLESPDPGGRVRFDGHDVTGVPVEHREVGMVFQSYALFPNMTVAGNVAYGLRLRRTPKAERKARVSEVLALCEVESLADRPVSALSGGQRQRVALARAVAVRPRVLLLDEPLSALDAALRERLRDDLARLLRAVGITAVFVTHDQAEALAIADRVAVMRQGRIVQLDTPRGLYRQPADPWVAGFVGGAVALGGRVEDGWLHLPGGRLALDAPPPPGAALLVRPGGLVAVPTAQATLHGTVRLARFLGDRLRLEVEGAADLPLVVDAPPDSDIAASERIGLALRPGGLVVPVSQAQVTPEEAP